MATVNLFGDLALDDSVQETNNKLDNLTVTRSTANGVNQTGIAVMAVRRDEDTAGVVDGNIVNLAVDDEGRLKTSTKTGSFATTNGAISTSGNTLVVDVKRASNVVFHLKNTGTATMAAGAFAFEASVDSTDGSNGTWFSIQAIRSNANTIEVSTPTLSITAGAGLTYSWEASVNAYQYMRIRCTTSVTASSIATWTIQRGTYATEPIPAAQASATQTISGTVTANSGTLTAGTTYNLVSAATTNAAVVKASAGSLYELTISNTTATPAYVKFYNKATAPTVGTDVPVLTIPVPATAANAGTIDIQFGVVGKRFATGIGIAVTGAVTAVDTTATVAGIQINATYI